MGHAGHHASTAQGHLDRITSGWLCAGSAHRAHPVAIPQLGTACSPPISSTDPRWPTSIMHSLRARSFFPLLLLDPFRPKSTDGAEPRAGSDGFVPGMNLQLSAVTAPELPTFQTASAHDPPSKANPCRALHPVLGIPHRGGSSQASLPLCPKHRVGFTSSKGPRVPSCSHAALHTSFFPWREAG